MVVESIGSQKTNLHEWSNQVTCFFLFVFFVQFSLLVIKGY
jgi:hypothetical protein